MASIQQRAEKGNQADKINEIVVPVEKKLLRLEKEES